MTKDWVKIAGPRFTLATETRMYDMAVDPGDPDHFFVGSNTEVMETKDGGCTWRSSYQDPSAISIDLQIATGDGSAYRLILVVERAEGTRIVISKDAGQTWTESADSIQELVGTAPCRTWRTAGAGRLAVAPSNPKTMYLCVSPYYSHYLNGFAFLIYRSDDGGETWTLASDLVSSLTDYADRYGGPPGTGNLQLHVDPLDVDRLWAVGRINGHLPTPRVPWHGFLAESGDGAATWQEVRRVEEWPRYGDLVVTHQPGKDPSLLLVSANANPECPQPDAGCLLQSKDGGLTWGVLPLMEGLVPWQLEPGANPKRMLVVANVGGGTYVYRFDLSRNTWVDISPPDGEQYPRGVDSSVEGKDQAFFFLGQLGTVIDRYTGKV